MAKRKRAKKTAFVPRSLFAGAVGIGVIPLCVSACGGLEKVPQSSGSAFGGVSGSAFGGVASGAFGGVSGSAFGGVSGTAFGGIVASGAFSVGTSAFGDSGPAPVDAGSEGVAATGFFGDEGVADVGFASPPEPNVEAGKAHDATIDAPELTVAFMGFDASTPDGDAGDKG
jgi:hypothetical protein